MYILDEFYVGLDEKKIFGSKCSKCKKVYFPPKIRCKKCLEQTNELIELSQTGILKNFIDSYSGNHVKQKHKKKKPELYGLVQIEKTSDAIIMPILNTEKADLKPGMKVKVVWGIGKITDTPHIIGFEPIDLE
ncbi:hypothetical protein LCGC14_1171360 [marine sediment metagenome]|uniref:ChsH2 rubredoxin-like zinc ribbon domain-containing protein n=1 Tax=marine sediment metagenome TaxID=412755 RepID=A0A0F9P7X7_9ZZZZ